MKKKMLKTLSEKIGNSSVLLILLFTILIIPTIPDYELRRTVFSLMLTIIFFMGVLAMEKYRMIILKIAILALIVEWISFIFQLPLLDTLSRSINIIFFMLIVSRFILQIARTKEVDAQVIIESINGYLLLGLAFAILVSVVHHGFQNSFKFPGLNDLPPSNVVHLNEYIYYTFVTMTTLGYGDIVPIAPVSKSLALLISISGQIYIAIIIAMLVGKYASNPKGS